MLENIMEIAKLAGQLMLNSANTIINISSKSGKGNFVTQIDVKVQAFLKSELIKLIPGASFMGEEEGEDRFTDAEYLFIVDPIDGTENFIRNFRYSCVSIALIKNGSPYIGVVYNPYQDELFCAVSCSGAFLNGNPIHVSDNHICDALVLFGSVPYYRELSDKTFDIIKKIMPTVADVRRCGS